MKYVLVIGDGMADDPLMELDGKTPLQYADIPTFDKLAGDGVFGNVVTIPDGLQAGSDTAILSIFGCDPREYFSGRAPLEAAATDIVLSPGDVAYRCNMISISDDDVPFEKKKILSHSAGSIGGAESNALVSALFDSPLFKETAEKAGIEIYPGSSFRHLAVQRVANVDRGTVLLSTLCHERVDRGTILLSTLCHENRPPVTPVNSGQTLTPPHDHLDEELGLYLPCGDENASVLEKLIRLSYEILNNHPINIMRRDEGKLPANCIWFWAEGTAVELPDFSKRYGKTGGIVSAVPLCRGIGSLIGLEKIIVEGATGELNTNYEGKVDAAVESLRKHDFTAIHVEAPDECTHNGDLKGKIQAIEWIDSRVLAPIIKKLQEDGTEFRMLVMTDHRTLLSTRGHDSGPVPYVLYDSRECNNTGLCFNEKDAVRGEFVKAGTELMDLLFEA